LRCWAGLSTCSSSGPAHVTRAALRLSLRHPPLRRTI